MRKRIAVLLLLGVLFCTLAPLVFADNRDTVVYIASGSSSAYRYHASPNCSSLSRSVVGSLTLEEAARRGYTACSRCHPPKPDFDVSATPRPKTEGGGSETVSSSQRSSQSQSFTDTPVIPDGKASTRSKSAVSSKSSSNSSPLLWSLGVAAASVISIRALTKWKKNKAEEEKQRAEQAERERIAKEKWQREKGEYEKLYSSTPTLIACGAPKDCFVGDDGLPARRKGVEKWGEGFTFYTTSSGQCYHKASCKVAKNHYASPVNAYRAKTGYNWYKGEHRYYACSYCGPVLPDLSWYEKYLEIKKIRKDYDIPEPNGGS